MVTLLVATVLATWVPWKCRSSKVGSVGTKEADRSRSSRLRVS
jgi:hypothetical protein